MPVRLPIYKCESFVLCFSLSPFPNPGCGPADVFPAMSARPCCAGSPACRLRWRRKLDLGLCGPFRTDLAQRTDLCGAFKVPTLRNVAISAPYFHNGQFRTLEEIVGFYVRRDTNPEEWSPRNADGYQP
jgi:cytochrome c peroxidase